MDAKSLRRGMPVRVLPHTVYKHLHGNAVLVLPVPYQRRGYETTIRSIFSEEMQDEDGQPVHEIMVEVSTGEIFAPDQLEAIE